MVGNFVVASLTWNIANLLPLSLFPVNVASKLLLCCSVADRAVSMASFWMSNPTLKSGSNINLVEGGSPCLQLASS